MENLHGAAGFPFSHRRQRRQFLGFQKNAAVPLTTELNMRTQIVFSTILVASLLGSTLMVVAQTGEFVATVPAEVVRAGQALQDEFQAARSGKTASRTDRTYGLGDFVKPRGDVTTTIGPTTSSGESRRK